MEIEREFECDIEGIEVKCVICMDVCMDEAVVKKIVFDNDQHILDQVRDYITESLPEDPDFDPPTLLDEEHQYNIQCDAEDRRHG